MNNRLQERLVKERGCWNLLLREHEEGLNLSADVMVRLIAENPDDRIRLEHARVLTSKLDLHSQRFLTLEVFSGEGFVDDRYKRSRGNVIIVDHASAYDGRSEGSGAVATHGRDSRRARIRRIIRLPHNLEVRT